MHKLSQFKNLVYTSKISLKYPYLFISLVNESVELKCSIIKNLIKGDLWNVFIPFA